MSRWVFQLADNHIEGPPPAKTYELHNASFNTLTTQFQLQHTYTP